MEALLNLTFRDWMVIVGSLLILAVIIDALRRMQQERRSRVRVKLARAEGEDGAEEIDDIAMMRELPNGGARVLKREDLLAARRRHEAEQAGRAATKPEAEDLGSSGEEANVTEPPARQRPNPLDGVRPDRGEPANLDWLEDLPQQSPDEVGDDAGALPRDTDSEVIILHVVAGDDRGFDGKGILEILLACDLRFGDMNFFHRHEREAGRGPLC